MAETIAELLVRHRADPAVIVETVQRCYARIRDANDPAIFISLRDENVVLADIRALAAELNDPRPLLGIPVAVKDNIDVTGMPSTAACPAFSYVPQQDATAVARLRKAGALIIGKTNLDQFATGLVGVRSPYGIPQNPLREDLVPGGSSSGSAVAVSRGIVPLALGTDTAGSGRVPAQLNNIVGLKPSVGLVSCAGVVPACRSLDCVSIFALTAEDAFSALKVIAGIDDDDAYSRGLPLGHFCAPPPCARIAVPRAADRFFFGDTAAAKAFDGALTHAYSLGWTLVEVDLMPFLDTARLLYEGAWLAERTAAVGDFITKHPDDVHPVTKSIISPGADRSAVDAFRGFYRLKEYGQKARAVLADVDALMVPTAPTNFTLADLEADPIGPNARLGTYTNFVNLLDLCGFAVPSALTADRMPYGVTFLARSGADAQLASLGAAFHAETRLPLGAFATGKPPAPPRAAGLSDDEITIAVVGAHMSGMPLNSELQVLGARFIEATSTSRDYQLFSLADAKPPKPGLLRVADGKGSAIAVEIWALAAAAFGKFVAAVPPPMTIGSVRLADGRVIKGFLVEREAVRGARDISSFGGWRAAMAAQ